MSVGALSTQQLRSIVEEKWDRDDGAIAVGLHVAAPWAGPPEVEFDFGTARVVRADTVFGVRQALRDAERDRGRVVVLTRLQQADLGHDVVARLARSRLFAIDHWATLCALFRAKELDPTACDPALAQALIEHAPPDGYPPVSAGILDGGTVWRAIGRHVFEMGESEPDLVSLLLWATTKAGSARYLVASPELRASLRRRLVDSLGDAADSILRFVEGGSGPDALALAAACEVVFGDGTGPTLEAAAARMEQYHGNRPIPPSIGRCLMRVATDAVADLDRRDDPQAAHRHLQRADELLRQFLCEEHAHRSRLTPLGYEQRLARFGAGIDSAVITPTGDAIRGCERLRAEITEHRVARLGRRREQIARTEMALRLVRWLGHPSHDPTSFPEFAHSYRRESSFVDWARESVCRGEEVAGLSKAYQSLDRAVLERRERFNRLFAVALADWTSVGSEAAGVWGVEDVAGRVVAGAVEAGNRVLLVVLDGMSWAICHELLDDIRHEHWSVSTLDESAEPPRPVVAAIPSVTGVSRASLLSGTPTVGDAAVEARNFEANPHLKACCDKKHPPVLFHKKEVTEGARGAVGDELSGAILSPTRKVVGVVLNAIDDRLAGAQQIRDDWTIGRIGPLGPLLKLARDSGRVVILASDHGHVWHRPDARHVSAEGGGRWRPTGGALAEDEILLAGNRVRDGLGGHSVVVPWSERVRYGRPQNGYHGGATPQEMLCPLVILADQSSAYSGLFPCEYPRPDWWSSAPTKSAPIAEEATIARPSPPKRPPTLFDNIRDDADVPKAGAAKGDGWLNRLFSSQVYKDQKGLIRRHAPEDEVVRRALAVLEAGGGLMTPAAFSNAAAIPAARLDGLVARIQRLLNVDGYEILDLNRSENKIELNVAKLRRQFDLG
ncbi:MAG: PglZ protein [Planctomycetota bacterium]|nr:PglZ protein [Planctomycetota bacterium]